MNILIAIGKWLAGVLIDKIIAAAIAYYKRLNEERKTNEQIKKRVKQLRQARTEEEIRDAVNNINL